MVCVLREDPVLEAADDILVAEPPEIILAQVR
jgi:hypothetical protein